MLLQHLLNSVPSGYTGIIHNNRFTSLPQLVGKISSRTACNDACRQATRMAHEQGFGSVKTAAVQYDRETRKAYLLLVY